MRILLLGTFEVLDAASQPIPLGSRMMPLLLARLALSPQKPLPAETLLHDLWNGQPPGGGIETLRRLASRTRARLRKYGLDIGPISTDRGLMLDLTTADIDAYQFEEYSRQGTQALTNGAPARALELFNDACTLWRSTPLTGIIADFAEHEAERLIEIHRQIVENQLSARAQLGETTTLLPDLQEFCQLNPTREHSHLLYLRLLAAIGERAQALRLYEKLRRRLSQELGTDPSYELQALHAELLRDQPRPTTAQPAAKSYLTRFFGREAELESLAQLFTQTRLVTIVGSGGIGKTRLASEYIARNQGLRRFFIDLAAVGANDNLVNTIATTLGIADQFTGLNPSDRLNYLATFLEAQPTLMVLDNSEHVIDSAATVCDNLLSACPSLQVLATSREPLAIIGEALLRITPLPANPAAEMFTAIATMANPCAHIDHNTVLEICQQLDGIPLAIELTAARVRTMTTTEITAHLEHNFYIVAHTRQQHNRHSTLRAVLEWTWQLLKPAEQELARRLSILTGGVTTETAAALLSNQQSTWEISQMLHSLADKSLLHTDANSPQRWWFLSPIRFYLTEKLAADQQEEYQTRLAAAQYYAELADRCFRQLLHGDQITANQIIAAEMDNCILSLRFARDTGLTELGAQLTLHLGLYWTLHLHLPELEEWIFHTPWELAALPEQFTTVFSLFTAAFFPQLTTPPELPLTPEFLDFYPTALLLKWKAYDHTRELPLADIHLAMTHSDPWVQATSEVFLGRAAQNQADLAKAQYHFRNAQTAFRALNDAHSAAAASMFLAELYSFQGEHEQAIAAITTAIAEEKTSGFNSKVLTDSIELGIALVRAGKITEANQQLSAVLEENHTHYNPIIAVLGHLGLSRAALATGDIQTAISQLHLAQNEVSVPLPDESVMTTMILLHKIQISLAQADIAQARQHFHSLWNAETLAPFTRHLPEVAEHAAQIFQAQNQPTVAAEILGAAATMRGSFDYGNPVLLQLRTELLSELGLASFDSHYDHGRSNPDVGAVLDEL